MRFRLSEIVRRGPHYDKRAWNPDDQLAGLKPIPMTPDPAPAASQPPPTTPAPDEAE